MKIEILQTVNRFGIRFKAGKVVNVRDQTAVALINSGIARKYVQEKTQPHLPAKNKQAENSFSVKAKRVLSDAGVEFDGRWGDKRLQELLDEHKLTVG